MPNLLNNFAGQVWATPTDTCYWFSCPIDDQLAINNIRNLKNRTENKPFSVLFINLESVKKYCLISAKQEAFMLENKYYSSFILNQINSEDSMCVRIENDKFPISICSLLNSPVITTSVNISWQKELNTAQQIKQKFWANSFLRILEVDNFISRPPSTIYDIRDILNPKILRH